MILVGLSVFSSDSLWSQEWGSQGEVWNGCRSIFLKGLSCRKWITIHSVVYHPIIWPQLTKRALLMCHNRLSTTNTIPPATMNQTPPSLMCFRMVHSMIGQNQIWPHGDIVTSAFSNARVISVPYFPECVWWDGSLCELSDHSLLLLQWFSVHMGQTNFQIVCGEESVPVFSYLSFFPTPLINQ